MALAPIALFSNPFVATYNGYFVKAYEQGTTTPLTMAIDSTGVVTVSKAEISSGGAVPEGFIKTTGDAIFIPYIDGAYDLFLFPTGAEADANDFTNAVQVADNLFLELFVNAVISDSDNSNVEISKIHDNVADMVADADLIVGKIVNTLGYFAVGDGGDNVYEIVGSGTGTDDGGTFIDLAGSGLQAKGLFPGDLAVDKQFGTKNDASTDDTVQLQAWLDASSGTYRTVASPGTAMVEAVTANINIPSNTHLTFTPGAKWKVITNSSDSYILMDIRDVVNVFIYNPVLEGDKDTHTGVTGEQGHTLNVSEPDVGDTSNIHIYNPVCTNTWGDGIVIRKGSNLHFYNAVCDDARRNGITINKGIDVHFHGTTVAKNTDGIAPEAGLDIEPNDATGDLKNITFDRLITSDNTGPGCTINLGDFPDGTVDKEISITIGEHIDAGSIYGLNIEKMGEGTTEELTGSIKFGKQIYTLNQSCGVYFNDYTGGNSPVIYMDELTIINPNALNSSSSLFGAGFGIDRKSSSGLTNSIGNCVIDKLRIVDNRSSNQMTRGVGAFDNDSSGADLENFKIIDPIEISGYDAAGDAFHVGINGMELSDRYFQAGRVLAGSLSITSRTYSRISTSNGSLFTVTDGMTKDNSGSTLELFTNGAGGIRFDPSAGRAVRPLSSGDGKYVQSTEVGARLVLEYDAVADDWLIVSEIGTWTVEP